MSKTPPEIGDVVIIREGKKLRLQRIAQEKFKGYLTEDRSFVSSYRLKTLTRISSYRNVQE